MPTVLHIAGQLPAHRIDTLRALRNGTTRFDHRILLVGRDALAPREFTSITRVHVPPLIPWIAAGRVARVVESISPQLVHFWDCRAVDAALSATPDSIPCIAEFDLSEPPDRLARWHRSATPAGAAQRDGAIDYGNADHSVAVAPDSFRLQFVSPTLLARRRLMESGVAPDACTVIRESVDFGEINRARQSDIRRTLELDPSDRVVLVLPPVSPRRGAFNAVWASLLASVVRSDIRVVLPGDSPESRRLRRLVLSTGHARISRFPGDALALPELLSVADVCLYLPPGDAPISSLMWAMAAGVPIVGSAVHAVTEFLADRHNAWLCRHDQVRGAARRILDALESEEKSREMTALARTQAFDVFGRRRMIRQYETACDNLVAGRPISSGIEDSAIIR